jgi:hypothetical protein
VMEDQKVKVRDLHTSHLHIHWVVRGTGTPKDRDEVNRREVSECDGCECEMIKSVYYHTKFYGPF